jgi:prepilin-type N-terminal cleavage/methylation domain-containing protein
MAVLQLANPQNYPPVRSACKGFTLIELCISIALMGLVAVGATVGIQSAMDAAISNRAEHEENHLGIHIISRLRQDLMTATSVTIPTANQLVVQPGPTAAGTTPPAITWVYNGSNTFTREGTDIRDFISMGSQTTITCKEDCFSGVDESGASTTGVGLSNPVAIVTFAGLSVNVASNDALSQTFTSTGFENEQVNFHIQAANSFQ